MRTWTRWTLLVAAVAMPAVSYVTQLGAFGGRVGEVSDRYQTLIVPAGYAFAIWGLIFLLDLGFAFWQVSGARARTGGLARLRPWATTGFALTALWTPVFGQQAWTFAVVVIWLALATLLVAAGMAARADAGSAAASTYTRIPLALHAGWLSLAAFANTAQWLLAMELTTASSQWLASAVLWFAAAVLLCASQRALAPARVALWTYTAAAVWGLVGVVVEQRGSALPGASASAVTAAALIGLLCLHLGWLLRGSRSGITSHTGHPARG